MRHNNDKTPRPIEFGDLSNFLLSDDKFNIKLSQKQFLGPLRASTGR